MGHALEETRALDNATQQDEQGRYYRREKDGAKVFGYHTWLGGLWVCYTCGHLCDCYEMSEEDID